MKSIDEINREAYEYSIGLCHNFDQLYKSINNYLGATALGYVRYLEDGSFLFFGDGCKGARIVQKAYFLPGNNLDYKSGTYFDFVKTLLVNETGFYMYPRKGLHSHPVAQILDSYNIKTIWGFCKKTPTYVEDFRFSFDKNRTYIELLEKTQDLGMFTKHIRIALKDLLYTKNHKTAKLHKNCMLNSNSEMSIAYQKQKFLDFLTQYDVHIGILRTLSDQEYKCSQYTVEGKTMNDIGDLLNISSRTVETYINNAKTKTGCNFKSKLIDKFFYHFYDKQL